MNLSEFIATRMNSLRQSGRLLLKEREWLLEKERVNVSALHVQEHADLDVVTATRNANGDVVGFTPSGISLPPKILINYHNGETGLVVAAGAAEALFGPRSRYRLG